MKIYHLSHIDFDGYGAQFVTNHYFKNISFFNANYGREIDEKFDEILSLLDGEESIVLITDLNLTPLQCELFSSALLDKNAKLFLLDHHATGAECASNYDWYYLDISRCATMITYEFFSEIYGKDEKLEKFCKVVNAVDIWLSEDENMEMGKVGQFLVSSAKELNRVMFKEESNAYIAYLLSRASEYFNDKNDYIGLDAAIHSIKKDFFRQDEDETLSNLVSRYLLKILSANFEKYEIFYKDYKGILTYNIEGISVVANDFLVANPHCDFFINITSKKTLSFRSNDKVDVSAMAKHLVGGGGHVNASGGLFAGFKDGYNYDSIKAQVVDLIKRKTQEEDI
ncbi:MAG: 3'-to-5' oligoribonuclease B [Campylobacter sp.]|nr:3'-to-5' oligoribonuclease B [Campylobacter sp.]